MKRRSGGSKSQSKLAISLLTKMRIKAHKTFLFNSKEEQQYQEWEKNQAFMVARHIHGSGFDKGMFINSLRTRSGRKKLKALFSYDTFKKAQQGSKVPDVSDTVLAMGTSRGRFKEILHKQRLIGERAYKMRANIAPASAYYGGYNQWFEEQEEAFMRMMDVRAQKDPNIYDKFSKYIVEDGGIQTEDKDKRKVNFFVPSAAEAKKFQENTAKYKKDTQQFYKDRAKEKNNVSGKKFVNNAWVSYKNCKVADDFITGIYNRDSTNPKTLVPVESVAELDSKINNVQNKCNDSINKIMENYLIGSQNVSKDNKKKLYKSAISKINSIPWRPVQPVQKSGSLQYGDSVNYLEQKQDGDKIKLEAKGNFSGFVMVPRKRGSEILQEYDVIKFRNGKPISVIEPPEPKGISQVSNLKSLKNRTKDMEKKEIELKVKDSIFKNANTGRTNSSLPNKKKNIGKQFKLL